MGHNSRGSSGGRGEGGFQITGNVGCWLATFLDSGSQRQAVAVDGRVSSLSPVISGITLGTELVPVLFLIHIEDIARGVSPSTSTTYLLMIQGQSKHEFSALQQDFRAVWNWAEDVNTKFSTDKIDVLPRLHYCTVR